MENQYENIFGGCIVLSISDIILYAYTIIDRNVFGAIAFLMFFALLYSASTIMHQEYNDAKHVEICRESIFEHIEPPPNDDDIPSEIKKRSVSSFITESEEEKVHPRTVVQLLEKFESCTLDPSILLKTRKLIECINEEHVVIQIMHIIRKTWDILNNCSKHDLDNEIKKIQSFVRSLDEHQILSGHFDKQLHKFVNIHLGLRVILDNKHLPQFSDLESMLYKFKTYIKSDAPDDVVIKDAYVSASQYRHNISEIERVYTAKEEYWFSRRLVLSTQTDWDAGVTFENLMKLLCQSNGSIHYKKMDHVIIEFVKNGGSPMKLEQLFNILDESELILHPRNFPTVMTDASPSKIVGNGSESAIFSLECVNFVKDIHKEMYGMLSHISKNTPNKEYLTTVLDELKYFEMTYMSKKQLPNVRGCIP